MLTQTLETLMPPSQQLYAEKRLAVLTVKPPLYELMSEADYWNYAKQPHTKVEPRFVGWIEPHSFVGWWVGFDARRILSDGERFLMESRDSVFDLYNPADPYRHKDWKTLAGELPHPDGVSPYQASATLATPWSILRAQQVRRNRGELAEQYKLVRFSYLPPDPEGLAALSAYWRHQMDDGRAVRINEAGYAWQW